MIETVRLHEYAFDPDGVLRALAAEECEFVLIGGVAATIHGSPLMTSDLDTIARRSRDNRERLASSLNRLEARPLVSIDWLTDTAAIVDQPIDATILNDLDPARLLTNCGVVDIMWTDAAVGDWAAWNERALDVDVDGVSVRVGSVQDLIRSKEHAGRPKDRAGLPFLREILRLRGDD